MDNFYTSPELFDILLQNKTDVYGTVRRNRHNMPSDFMKDNLKRGKVVEWQKGKMMALRWKDKKNVCILSTVHNAACSVDKSRGEKEVQKLATVLDYNHTMGRRRQG